MSARATGRRLPAVAAVLTAGFLLLPVPVASAQPAAVTAAPTAESWYRTLPAELPPEADPCGLATGCLPAAPAPLPGQYAPGTLHVGVSGGTEESRTYLALDLSAVPFGSAVEGGTLTLPVAADPQAGSVAPESAALRVCAVTGPVPDGVDGGTARPPAVDCATSSAATYRPAEGDAPAAFTVDVAPFAGTWGSGPALLAVLPAEEPEPAATWHVAFSRRDRAVQGAVPISAALLVAPSDDLSSPAAAPSTEVAPPTGSGLPDLPPLGSGASFAAPPLAAPESSLSAPVTPSVAAPTARVPVAAVLGGAYAYPAVFLLPLVVAGAVGWAGRALTRDLVPGRA